MEADLVIAGTSVSTLIVSVIQLGRALSPNFTKKAAPLIAILLGLTASYFYNLDTHQLSLFQTIFMGISVGFQAIGIYASTTSSLKEEKKQVEAQVQQMSHQNAILASQLDQAKVISALQEKKE